MASASRLRQNLAHFVLSLAIVYRVEFPAHLCNKFVIEVYIWEV